jgi:DNA-binding NtrC family response regulator
LARGATPGRPTLRILVIDDDALVRTSLAAILASLGHEPVAATGAVEGIEQAEERHFDVAIVDMKMPGMDGLEAVKALVRIEPRIPVIGMSGGSLNPDIDYAVLATRLGAQAFLHKPFTREELVRTIEAAVAA